MAADNIMALAVMRSLARCGIPVYCAVSTRNSLPLRSRYCSGWFEFPGDETRAIASILHYGQKWGVTHLIGMSENHIALLNRWREDLERCFVLLFPPQEIFERARKKHITLEYAARLGLRIPLTLRPQSLAETEACKALPYPVVLKMSHRDLPPERRMEFPHKSLLVRSYAELIEVLRPLTPGCYPMVQEYIPGHGVGLSVLMRKGKALMAFQHRRIREYPVGGGVSVYCESMPPDRQLASWSERLLKEMDWEGVAMVEYRGDEAAGGFALMEVNGRFWGSLPLAISAGADFPFWLYRTSLSSAGELPPADYRTGIRMRSLAGDTKWLLDTVRTSPAQLPSAVWSYVSAFRPGTRYFVWDWRDPMPSICNAMSRLRVF